MIRPLAAIAILWFTMHAPGAKASGTPQKPNVVFVLTDDQAFGDLGCHGNPVLQTPNIDKFAKQSVECRHFYVNPVCSPTRASLMTGRYNFRTGVVDTFAGRSLMRPNEITLAQLLERAGYRTGLFGKWHLGDNYPLRPQEHGFQEVLMLRGGGIGQPSDPKGSSYAKPILEHNGKLESFNRYCTDLFTDEAIKFIEQSANKPFLVYLAFNCPHTPLQAPEAETARYRGRDLSATAFPKIGQPFAAPVLNSALLARLYGMETNIDENFGRLLKTLDDLKLADNTIVIFMSDNGPQEGRYNAGSRGRKGTVYEGGIRVPFFVRWPTGGIDGGKTVDDACAHIDILPTLVAACGATLPTDRPIDGVNLLPRWRGNERSLRDRSLFFQWHRGDVPERFRACAVRESQYKLVQGAGAQEKAAYRPSFELFDIGADPFESTNVAERHPDVVARMKAAYERWFADVTGAGFAPVRPQLCTAHENPTRLTRQDWRGPKAANWEGNGLGYWEVSIPTAGSFDVSAMLKGVKNDSTIHFRLRGVDAESGIMAGATEFSFRGLKLPAGDARLEVWVEHGGESVGVWDVQVRRVE